jgi:hypothetical protein
MQRTGRRGRRFVINVPPPTVVVAPAPAPAPAPAQSSPPTIWARLWAISKTVGPALISLAAILVALAAFLDQRAANSDQRLNERVAAAASANASQRQWADQVSFLQSRIGIIGPGTYVTVEVQNASISPVTNGAFTVSAIAFVPPTGPSKSFNVTLYFGNIPPCSTGFPNVAAQLQIIAEKELGVKVKLSHIGFQINAMYFTDRNGVGWKESVYGSLDTFPLGERYIRVFPPMGRDSNLTVNYRSANGCG